MYHRRKVGGRRQFDVRLTIILHHQSKEIVGPAIYQPQETPSPLAGLFQYLGRCRVRPTSASRNPRQFSPQPIPEPSSRRIGQFLSWLSVSFQRLAGKDADGNRLERGCLGCGIKISGYQDIGFRVIH